MKHHNHKLTYVNFFPEGLRDEHEPSILSIVAGAALCALALYCVTIFLFSL
jgi:hypothetical protein